MSRTSAPSAVLTQRPQVSGLYMVSVTSSCRYRLREPLTWLIVIVDDNGCFPGSGHLVLHEQRNQQTLLVRRHLETHSC